MTKVEEAKTTFQNGYNCAQSVLAVFADDLKLKRELGLKLATGLGAGLGYQGQTCGVVLGAYLVLGLRFGSHQPHDADAKELCYAMTREFDRQFLAKNQSLTCSGLLGKDLSIIQEYEEASQEKLFDSVCPLLVEDTVLILRKMIENNEFNSLL